MRAEMFQRDFSFNPGQNAPEGASCDALRQKLGRPDLDDEALREAVSESVERSQRMRHGADKQALIDKLMAGEVSDDLARAVLASLCLPAPRAPLSMPTQVLERERAPVFSRLFSRVRARLG